MPESLCALSIVYSNHISYNRIIETINTQEDNNLKTSKYIACLDYKASYAPLTLDYKVLNAANILDAMNEAEQYLDKEKVYLITVMERKSSKPAAGWMRGTKVGTYRDVLTNRGYGWHSTDEAHSEQAFEHECWYIPDGSLLFD